MKIVEKFYPKIEEAVKVLEPVIHRTPLKHSHLLSDITGAQVYLKLENLQKTGSFKIRGAYYKLSRLSPRERRDGVITASSGNHAQAVAYAAKVMGIPATVVMPVNASPIKVEACRGYGAEVIFHGEVWDDAHEESLKIAERRRLTYVHPFNDPDIICGQGTLGAEIYEDLGDAEAAVVPIGGGGLVSGVALALKKLNPRIHVFGVQPERAPSMKAALEAGKPVDTPVGDTMADGLAGRRTGDLTFKIVRALVEDVATVSEEAIARAVILLLERCKTLVEPSGAASVAAIISGGLDLEGKKIVAVVSGGNVDLPLLAKIIEGGVMKTC
ncbi:MAG: threonine ammonia-lyase [Candidatus Geothermarchaeales archaeon]